jgi:hydroxymethylpyrimidine/phosphomethylpyrimidine kinase
MMAEYINTRHTHGTGCTLSASLASNLAKDLSIKEAVALSKTYITEAIKNGFKVGKGNNPVNHIFSL